jgi:hypothetical protein
MIIFLYTKKAALQQLFFEPKHRQINMVVIFPRCDTAGMLIVRSHGTYNTSELPRKNDGEKDPQLANIPVHLHL